MDLLLSKYNFWVFIVLFSMGLFGILVKKNLSKKIIALTIFQNSIILFFVSTAVKLDSTIPIIDHHHGAVINPDHYANPLAQVLMLTAIVVGVATLGVAMSLIQKIYRIYGTVEEDELSEIISKEEVDE